MTPVLLTQWLLFGYGGLTTMGVNIINSGVVAGLTGFMYSDLPNH